MYIRTNINGPIAFPVLLPIDMEKSILIIDMLRFMAEPSVAQPRARVGDVKGYTQYPPIWW